MSGSITKRELLEDLRAGRAEWDTLIAKVDPARLDEPGVEGEWSVKDIVAHVTWYEREMIDLFNTHVLTGSELWGQPQDARNAEVFKQNRERPPTEILAEAQQVFRELYAALQPLDDQDLNDPSRFQNMPGEWVPWQILAGNSFTHYPDHIPSIEQWLARQ